MSRWKRARAGSARRTRDAVAIGRIAGLGEGRERDAPSEVEGDDEHDDGDGDVSDVRRAMTSTTPALTSA